MPHEIAPPATPWVAFIRAINGAPANRIRNVALVAMIAEAGCADVAADGHTGNVFLRADDEPGALACRIEQRLAHGGLRKADVVLRSPAELAQLVESAPFVGLDPAVYDAEATFFRRPPQQRDVALFTDRGGIVAHVDDSVLCLARPRPRAGEAAPLLGGANPFVERHWGVPATSRAWQVVERVQKNCERWLLRPGGAGSP